MEPLELICEMIASDSYRDIGGSPQITKVYRNLTAEEFVVDWTSEPEKGPQKFLAGRPLLSYERVDAPAFVLPERRSRCSRCNGGGCGKSE